MKRLVFPVILFILIVCGNLTAFQYYPYDDCTQYIQPTSYSFNARMWGVGLLIDRETEDGYTITMGDDGYWYYATLDQDGEYTPSAYKVVYDSPPSGALHLRRSATRIAVLEAEMESIRQSWDDCFEYYLPYRDDEVTYRLGVLLVEKANNPGQKPPNNCLTQPYLMNMLVGENWNSEDDEDNVTLDNYPACGSLRDYFYSISNGDVIFEYGEFGDRDLLINPYNGNGEPQWLVSNSGSPSSLVNQCINLGWLPEPDVNDPVDPGFDYLVIIYANGCEFVPTGGGFSKNGWDGIDGNNFRFIRAPEWCEKLDEFANIHVYIHEAGHTFGLKDLYHQCSGENHWFNYPFGYTANNYFSGGFTGGFDPMGVGGGGDLSDWNEHNHPALNNACPYNPLYRAALGWCGSIEEVTQEKLTVSIPYSISEPEFYCFRYYFDNRDVSNGDIRWGYFILENRQCIIEEEGVWADMNSKMPGWIGSVPADPNDWKGFVSTNKENNLLI